MAYADSKIKQYLHIFVPSSLGVVMYVSLALLIIVLNQVGAIRRYLQLPQDLEIGRILTGWIGDLLNFTLGQSRAETFVVGLFWGIVGLAVYVFLHGLSKFLNELGEDIDERRFVWPRGTSRTRPLIQLFQRSLFRVSVLIALLIFLFYPVAAVLRGPVFESLTPAGSPLENLVWFLAITVALHISTVLLRLFMFRERLFD